ncbi:MAG: zf-HC2 domain-containing protein [Planctomycetes bacterium]|nr:zf-HC2 domain-containing protein [Planctomycetota bacterium]
MEFTCNEAVPLIGAYLDGELSEPRAALLRKHLLECHLCRNATQDGKSLKRWFAPAKAVAEAPLVSAVPNGFAARVARRAFAGDTGDRSAPFTLQPRTSDGRVLAFIVAATAVAAAIALVLALVARGTVQPTGTHLSADDRTPVSLTQIQSELEKLNQGSAPAPLEQR